MALLRVDWPSHLIQLKKQTKIWNNGFQTWESTENKQDKPHTSPGVMPGGILSLQHQKWKPKKNPIVSFHWVAWVRSAERPSQLEIAGQSAEKRGLHRQRALGIYRGPIPSQLRTGQQDKSSDQLVLKHPHLRYVRPASPQRDHRHKGRFPSSAFRSFSPSIYFPIQLALLWRFFFIISPYFKLASFQKIPPTTSSHTSL